MLFRFGVCELDTDTVELRVQGQRRPIEPQVYDLLAVLLQSRDRVVPKEEILDKVWGNRFVSESTLTSRVKSARQAVGDDGRSQRVIRTVHGRGYQFVASVEQVSPPGSGEPSPLLHAPAVSPLPVPTTGLVGRDRELAALCDLASRERLVTLLGPGGVGKTRLAIEAASRLTARHRDGVCFVELTKAREEKVVPDLVVDALGLRTGPGADPARVIKEALRGRSLLLVLDNFEHVIDAAPLVSELLEHAPHLRVITTSRERLRLNGEHVFEVSPLAVEAEAGIPAAIALFEQVARANDHSFRLRPANIPDLAAVCRAVDGLPLGIEIAAGQLRILPPALLRARLRSRIDVLSDGLRDRPARHQTIRDTLDWSFRLLPPAERRLFTRLAVFAGPASVGAIMEICGADLDQEPARCLVALVDKSLVHRVNGRDGQPRLAMLELVHEYATGLLAESDEYAAIRNRHAEYVADRLDHIESARWGDAAGSWIDEVNELSEEIRAARLWSMSQGDTRLAARIAASLYGHWRLEGRYAEGRTWTAEALEYAGTLEAPILGKLHLAAGYLEYYRPDMQGARQHWERATVLFDPHDHARWRAFSEMSVASTYIGDSTTYHFALQRCDDAIGVARGLAQRPLIAHGLNIKGELARMHGDDDLARVAYEEGLQLSYAAGDPTHATVFMANLLYLAQHRGDYERALALGREALRICWSLGRRLMAAWTVSELAGPELGLGHAERAAIMVGGGDQALRLVGAERGPADMPEHARVLADLRDVLGGERMQELSAVGRAMSLEEAVAYALSDAHLPRSVDDVVPRPRTSASMEMLDR